MSKIDMSCNPSETSRVQSELEAQSSAAPLPELERAEPFFARRLSPLLRVRTGMRAGLAPNAM